MASGFFAILDDIAALMDDVSVTAKVATRKTAGILGDDLAVNAEKATGFLSSRELPVLWAITKGSLLNKVIIIPVALTLNAKWPVAITVILILGGFYLAFEGMEKIIEFLFHRKKEGHEVVAEKQEEGADAEKTKIRSAIVTDFILSVEIVIIAMSTVLDKDLTTQILTVCVVALLATVGVYGIVALIVRMDDAGFSLIKRANNKGLWAAVGNLLVKALPIVIKILAVVGTLALLLVSGGIFTHEIEYLHHILPGLHNTLREFLFGITGGLIAVAVYTVGKKTVGAIKGS
jgi:uncharacterized protein